MKKEFIHFEVSNSIGWITLSRPDVMNSFNKGMANEVQNALDECKNNDDVRAIYLTGEGKGFSAGQDLAEA
ncbi:MAG: enoyl-CoA hydratase/isomerase family protein, partial [Flavobacteriales bacterium]